MSTADLTHASALLVGLVIGIALTLRLLRIVVDYLRGHGDERPRE